MKRIAYIYSKTSDATMEWMESYGYDSLHIEEPSNFHLRPRFRQILEELEEGDELIIGKISNVISSMLQLSLLIDLCQIRHIRLISVEDQIDTHERLFGMTSALRLMQILASLPKEIHSEAMACNEIPMRQCDFKGRKKEQMRQRDIKVLTMYMAGHSSHIIAKKCNISHTYIFRILKRNGVKCDRYPNRKSVATS